MILAGKSFSTILPLWSRLYVSGTTGGGIPEVQLTLCAYQYGPDAVVSIELPLAYGNAKIPEPCSVLNLHAICLQLRSRKVLPDAMHM